MDKEKEAIARGMLQELYAIMEDEDLTDAQKMALTLLQWLFEDGEEPELE